MLGRWVVHPIDPVSERIILKIVGFLEGARYNIYLFGFFETIGYHLIAMHIFLSRPNLKTTVLYSQASGLCLIVRNTGSRWLDIFTCKNPRPTHHIYWPVLSLFYYVQTRILWKRTNLQNDKSNQIEWKWKYLQTEFIQGIKTHIIFIGQEFPC